MLNSIEFTKRIKKVMEYYNLSASSFAEKIDVPRSSISHILSGRNKPSLDFVLKITKEFNEVDLYWLLENEGSFPKLNTPTQSKIENNLFTNPSEINTEKIHQNKQQEKTQMYQNDSNINKVLVFYNDGTFEEYKNRKQT